MESLFQSIYQGVTSGDWFLVAGAALTLTVMAARWALGKYWPSLNESDIKGIAITAALSGLGALATVWLAGEDPSAETLVGALKVWASAVWIYVTGKKLIAAKTPATGAGN